MIEIYLNGIDTKFRSSKGDVLLNQRYTNKPFSSFGILEKMGYKLSRIIGINQEKLNKSVVIFAADHGISEMHLSVFEKSHTQNVVNLLLQDKTPLSKILNKDVPIQCIDIGMASDMEDSYGVINKKVNYSTKNMLYEYAMTMHETQNAIEVGIELAKQCSEKNINIVALGEVGICNTISASVLTAILLDLPSDKVTGRGTGISKEKWKKKNQVVADIIAQYGNLKDNTLELLSAVGGYDICGDIGFLIGCAYYKIPVIIDGFITGAAALVACKLNPLIKEYMFASHLSSEPGHEYIMHELELEPLLYLNMRFGLATGASIALSLYETAYLLTNK